MTSGDRSSLSLFRVDPFLACPGYAAFLGMLLYMVAQCFRTESKHGGEMPQKSRFLEMTPKNFPRISML